MYARCIKHTFTNEVMKQSVINFMVQNFDLKNGMMMSFKLHLSENQTLHVGIFPDKETADKAAELVKPVREQITQMGVKSELLAGPLTDFMAAGEITLDQITQLTGKS